MAYRRLYVWLEGDDDARLFDAVLKPMLEKKYDVVEVIPYARKRKKKINQYLKAIVGNKWDYIFLRDLDDAPCATARKQNLTKQFPRIHKERIVVVMREIESWYLAGLDDKGCRALGVPRRAKTDAVTKEDFDRLRPKKYDSRTDFMAEILKRFSPSVARKKNSSFRYFVREHDC